MFDFNSHKKFFLFPFLPVAAITFVFGVFAISSESLWLDEAMTAFKTIQPTMRSAWLALADEHNTNLQMPLYFSYIWGWAQCFGSSERILRSANLPFIFLTLWSVLSFTSDKRRGFIAVTLLATAPFFWFYANEARPYMMLIGLSSLLLGPTAKLLEAGNRNHFDDSKIYSSIAGPILLIFGTHLGTILWILPYLLFLEVQCRGQFFLTWITQHQKSFSIFTVTLIFISIYYAYTFTLGIEPNHLAKTNLLNLMYFFYEFLGFQGLGPSRSELRMIDFTSVAPYCIGIAALALCWTLVFSFTFYKSSLNSFRMFGRWIVGGVVGPALLLVIVGYVQHTRILPRHLAPAFPFMIAGISFFVMKAWKYSGGLRISLSALLVTSLLSALTFRYSARHARDDYRGAAAFAQDILSKGKKIVWLANGQGAFYYGLKQTDSFKVTPDPSSPKAIEDIDMIILSRPEAYDADNSWRKLATLNGMKSASLVVGFELYSK